MWMLCSKELLNNYDINTYSEIDCKDGYFFAIFYALKYA